MEDVFNKKHIEKCRVKHNSSPTYRGRRLLARGLLKAVESTVSKEFHEFYNDLSKI